MNDPILEIKNAWRLWFKSEDDKQRKWIISYLLKRGELAGGTQMTSDELSFVYRGLVENNHHRAKLLLKEMKAAWSQKKTRDKSNGRKGYSFVMATDIQGKLKQLAKAKGLSMNIILEEMIKDCDSFKKSLFDEQRLFIKETTREFENKKKQIKTSWEQKKDTDGTNIKRLKKEIELLDKFIESTLLSHFRNSLILKENGLIDSTLTKEQENMASEETNVSLTGLKEGVQQEVEKINSFYHTFASSIIDR